MFTTRVGNYDFYLHREVLLYKLLLPPDLDAVAALCPPRRLQVLIELSPLPLQRNYLLFKFRDQRFHFLVVFLLALNSGLVCVFVCVLHTGCVAYRVCYTGKRGGIKRAC